MMISGINPATAKVEFKGTNSANKAEEKISPTFIYDADKLPEGYHWEHDLDYDRYVAVKNGYKFDEGKRTAVPDRPYMPNIHYAKPAIPEDVMYEIELREQPKEGYHLDYFEDGDRYYAIMDGYHINQDGGKPVKD